MSDLHVDTAPFTLPPTPADANVLVIAGDIGDGHHRSIRWLQHALPCELPIIIVAGNHDFYAGDLLDDCAEYYEKIGVTVLHAARPSVEIAGVRFVGSTLWTDYATAGDVAAAMWWAKQAFPDFWNIGVGMRRSRPADLLSAHKLQRDVISCRASAADHSSSVSPGRRTSSPPTILRMVLVVRWAALSSHGTNDRVWSVVMTRRLVSRLQASGRQPEAHYYEGEDHIPGGAGENEHHDHLVRSFERNLAPSQDVS